jgi:hypothetical protein
MLRNSKMKERRRRIRGKLRRKRPISTLKKNLSEHAAQAQKNQSKDQGRGVCGCLPRGIERKDKTMLLMQKFFDGSIGTIWQMWNISL